MFTATAMHTSIRVNLCVAYHCPHGLAAGLRPLREDLASSRRCGEDALGLSREIVDLGVEGDHLLHQGGIAHDQGIRLVLRFTVSRWACIAWPSPIRLPMLQGVLSQSRLPAIDDAVVFGLHRERFF